MAWFDSILDSASKDLGIAKEKAADLLTVLIGLIGDPQNGGFTGFLDRFREAGMEKEVDSWISGEDNAPISETDVENAVGTDTISTIAAETGIPRETASAGLAAMIPQVVDKLSPDAVVPDNDSFIDRVRDYLGEWGGKLGATIIGGLGIAGAAVGGAASKTKAGIEDVLGHGLDTVGGGFTHVRDHHDSRLDGVPAASLNRSDEDDKSGGSILNWLLPLILLALAMALGFWFCSGKTPDHPPAPQPGPGKPGPDAKKGESSFAIKADNGKYVVTGTVPDEAFKKRIVDGVTAQFGAGNVNFDGLKVDPAVKPFAPGWWEGFSKMLPNLKDWKTGSLAFAGNAITEAAGLPGAALDQLKSLFTGWTLPSNLSAGASPAAEAPRSLSEVTLPDGVKLQAYPGGIEDQLVKFISSDEYKNATNDTLRDKWFNFDDLNFVHGKTEMTPESKRQLDNIVAILKAFPDVKIKIGGYTDKTGDAAANKKLSDERAKAVQAALQKAGVGAQAPEAEGYGEEFATVDEGASDEARKVDRKTSVRLIK